MEGLLVLVALVVVAGLIVIPLLAIIALVRANELQRTARALEARVAALERAARRPAGPESPSTSGVVPGPASPVVAPVPTPEPAAHPAPAAAPRPSPVATPTPVPTPAAEPALQPSSAPAKRVGGPGGPAPQPPRDRVRAPVPARASQPPRRPAAPDFATQLGPRILVAMGALAFVVFLGLFVRYAWENQWVGPAGRVVLGALTGLALIAGGLRLMHRELRPLGQGLAAAGLASLFVSAFAAHGFYALVPRGFAGFMMLAITVCAVLLADRLDARLFAAIGWVGAYLTPALLSTGEDRALALFLYLALLNAGALWLDHRRPWPETLPLAVTGTIVLSLAWYGEHFDASRFDVAAGALVLFTAQFGLGAARKQRSLGSGLVLALAALGLSALAAGADRPASLMLLSLALAAAGLRLAAGLGGWLALGAGLAVGLPLAVWAGAHYDPVSFGVAALWIAGGAGLFAVMRPPLLAGLPPEAGAVTLGGLAAIPLAASSDRPLGLLALLLAQGLVAALARRRWRWAETAGVATAALAALTWLGEHYTRGRGPEAATLVLVLAGAWLLLLLGHGLLARRPAGWPDMLAHLVAAGLAWHGLDVVLGEGPWLGSATAAMAALYLALGLAALRTPGAGARQHRTLLGLAASLLTLAIPVQLGLYGITIGWALEGALLLALGTRFGSPLARLGGYAVLAASVLRLLAWHLPLHGAAFQPVLNPQFGTWLLVVGALAAAWRLARAAREAGHGLDLWLGPLLAAVALLLLLGLLTGETGATFQQRAREAQEAGLGEAAQAATFAGRLAVSALWASFATALLGAGLLARGRPLFYSGYALFALTAAKLLLIDLASLQTLYRMLSFLVLALLLMAGAWLNLRFRERLLPGGGAG